MDLSQQIGNIFFFSKKKNKKNQELEEERDFEQKMLCRFVLDGARKKIGESIALDDDIMIIKTEKKYLGIPLKHLEDDGKTLLVKGLVDRDKAEEMGEKWRNESFKKIQYTEEERNGF